MADSQCGGINGYSRVDDSLLFFFLLLVVLFCNSGFGYGYGGGIKGYSRVDDSLLFFFLILAALFCNSGFGYGYGGEYLMPLGTVQNHSNETVTSVPVEVEKLQEEN